MQRRAIDAIRTAISRGGPEIPVPSVTPLASVVRITLLPQRLAAATASALGIVGVLLAALGLHGVLAYAVVQRTKEIGIRLAIGARSREVLLLFLGEGLRLALVGGAMGLLAALALGRLLASLLFGVEATDPLALISVVVLLSAVSVLACWIPARRASRLDPVSALRWD